MRDGPFYEWKKRLRPREAEPFVAVQIAAAESPPLSAAAFSAPLEIRLSRGRGLLVGSDFDAGHLCRLWQVLEQET